MMNCIYSFCLFLWILKLHHNGGELRIYIMTPREVRDLFFFLCIILIISAFSLCKSSPTRKLYSINLLQLQRDVSKLGA